MKRQNRLRDLLIQTRPHWDRDDTRASVRSGFTKAIQCRTLELGAEVFSSEHQDLILCHTCKSRACPSCGYRATVQWQRERWAALPDVPYKGITFTMPDVLWALFRDNPHLTTALSALAARVIQARISIRSGLRIGVIAILHTFNGKLEFNSHVHSLVTAGGLYGLSDSWVPTAFHEKNGLLKGWRRSVIRLLRAALRCGELVSSLTTEQLEALLTKQENRWWSVKVQSFSSKKHFLGYAARYVRRPPIAQKRVTHVDTQIVRFWYKDKKLGRSMKVEVSPEEFIDRWGQHIPERYRHAVRSFGLFSPRGIQGTLDVVFAILRQQRRSRPKPRRWAESIKRDFDRDPLLDSKGQRMTWVRRIAPKKPC